MNSYNGIYTRKVINEDGDTEITFTIKGFADNEIIKELQKGTLYRFKASEVKSQRTAQQNRLMWALLEEIAEKDNGNLYQSQDVWDVYVEALERAQAKFEIVDISANAYPMLKEHYRAIQILNTIDFDGNVTYRCKVFYGSSKLDVKEMAKLLDIVIIMAQERGIPITTNDYE